MLSITMTSTGPLRASNRRPSCSVRAVKIVGPESSGGAVAGLNANLMLYVPVRPVMSMTGRSTFRDKLPANDDNVPMLCIVDKRLPDPLPDGAPPAPAVAVEPSAARGAASRLAGAKSDSVAGMSFGPPLATSKANIGSSRVSWWNFILNGLQEVIAALRGFGPPQHRLEPWRGRRICPTSTSRDQ